jgi:DNA-directed RNA polymerase subunit N (RpoN/RPB10)
MCSLSVGGKWNQFAEKRKTMTEDQALDSMGLDPKRRGCCRGLFLVHIPQSPLQRQSALPPPPLPKGVYSTTTNTLPFS